MLSKERIIIITLACVQFTHLMDFMIVMPLGPTLMRLYNITPEQYGIIVGSYALAAGLFGFIGAFFLDRFDRRKALLVSYAFFIVGTFACSLADGYYFLLITRMAAGAFGGLIITLLLSIVSDLIPYERRALAIGKIMMAFAFTSFAGIPVALYLADTFSWQVTFIFLGCLTLIAALLVYLFIPSMTSHLQEKTDKCQGFSEVREILSDGNHVRAYAVMFLLTVGQFTVVPFMSTYMVANVSFHESDIKYIYLFGGTASFFATPLIGKLADLWGKLRVYTILIFISIISIYSLTNLENVSFELGLVITTIFFVFMGGRTIPATTMISAAVISEKRGSFLSLNTAVRQLSVGIAVYLGGNMLLLEKTGHLENFDIVGWISIACSLSSLYLARSLKVRS